MNDLLNHPLCDAFTANPLVAWGCVTAAVGGAAFLVSRSVESMLMFVTAVAFTIVPALRLF